MAKAVFNLDLGGGIIKHTHPEVVNNTTDISTLSTEVNVNASNIDDILNNDVTLTGTKTLDGNVIVNGTFTALSSVIITAEELMLSTNYIDLNSNFSTGSPTEDAGIRVIRGDELSAILN